MDERSKWLIPDHLVWKRYGVSAMTGWRKTYKVHPAADLFPMMTDDELAALGEDIKANGLKNPIVFWEDSDGAQKLIDGRNRLEAIERAGVELPRGFDLFPNTVDPVAVIISLNIHRRHLTKLQQADLIVAAHRATPVYRQDGGKLAEGRPVNQVKAAAGACPGASSLWGIVRVRARRELLSWH